MSLQVGGPSREGRRPSPGGVICLPSLSNRNCRALELLPRRHCAQSKTEYCRRKPSPSRVIFFIIFHSWFPCECWECWIHFSYFSAPAPGTFWFLDCLLCVAKFLTLTTNQSSYVLISCVTNAYQHHVNNSTKAQLVTHQPLMSFRAQL